MRVSLILLGPVAATAVACSAAPPLEVPSPAATDNCAIVTAIAKEHYAFGPENPPPPLKAGVDGWQPQCDVSALGFAFSSYVDPPPGAGPRTSPKWVAFGKPIYDGWGALVQTEIMHGPLAGIGYECRLHSGIAGWAVGECKTSWVS